MSRTYRQLPRHVHRHNSGYAQALRAEGIRKGSIPPNPWNDNAISDEAWMPYKIVGKMFAAGKSAKDVRTVLSMKYNLTSDQVTKVIQSVINSRYYQQKFKGM